MQSLVRHRPAVLCQLGQGSKQTINQVHDIAMERHSRGADTQVLAAALSNWPQAIDIRINEITDGELTAVCN
jgi:hypothetical protein